MTSIHPRLQEFLAPYKEKRIVPGDMPIEELRAGLEKRLTRTEDQMDPIAQSVDQQVDDFTVRIFIPEGTGPFPVCLFFHGGGMVAGSVTASESISRKIANRTPCAVVSVEYSLSPEVRYPVALQQGYRALEWTHENIGQFGGMPERIAVAGESSGGMLAAGVALMSRDRGGPDIAFQLLLQPVASLECGPSEDQWLLVPEKMEWYFDQYAPSAEARKEPYFVPLNHESLQDLPPAFFILAEHDILTQGALRFLERLEKEGVAATGRVYKGMIHGFCSILPDFEPGDQALDEGINHLKEEFEVWAQRQPVQ